MRNEVEHRFRLDGKTILVTGASSGIGRQIAIDIAAMGGCVIITGRSEQKLSETSTYLTGEGHVKIPADLTVPEDIKRLATEISGIDGVVHCAGIVDPFPTRFVNQQKIDAMFAVNFNGPVLLMTALFKEKKINKQSSIVFISSFSSQYPYLSGGMYVSSKAALESYSKVLAVENYTSGLRSNCVCPALVKTEIYDKTFDKDRDPDAAAKSEKHGKLYLHGIGVPTDVSNMVLFLLSPASKWITGQSIILDGGYLLGVLSNTLSV